jgi:putative DNA primase/helicase
VSCLSAALDYGRRGFRVFPLQSVREGACTCQEWRDKNDKGPCPTPGKHPRFRNWQERATCDPIAIEEFWWNHKGSNVGIATGAGSGVFVLDVDPKNGGQESIEALVMKHGRIDTLQALTGSRGKHFYFAHPGKPVRNGVELLPGLDIRGDGGLVVAPPSIHVSGNRYEWDGLEEFADMPILPAPAWLLELIYGKRANGEKARFDLPAELTEGERNDTLHRYACSLRGSGGGLEPAEILNAVLAVNRSRCKPPLDDSEVQSLVESACRHEKGKGRRASAKGGDDDDRLTTNQLADMITADSHFAVDSGGKLYVFQKGVYKPTGESYIKRRVKTILGALDVPEQWSSRKAEEVVKYIAVDAPELWDRPAANIVNVENGLLDVRKRVLEPHSPDFLSPVQIPVRYVPAAHCPAWDKFIAEVFPEDTEAIAWEIPAWLMTPDTSIQKAILLTGDGANGKSTYLRAVLSFIGKHNASALSLHKLENDRFSAARLVGRLANICPDLPTTDLVSTSVFKAITGGDPLMAEYKFKDSFEFIPYARLVFSATHPPKSQDASPAFFRRWVVVPFERTFTDGAPGTMPRDQLDAMLADPEELSGVLNKALEAIVAIRSRGFSESDSTRRAMDEFRQATDPLAVWLDRHTVLHPDAVIPQDRLYREYGRNCSDAGRPTISKTAFGRAMKKLRPTIGDYQRTVNGMLAWCYIGIGLVAKENE